jgi:hypothetical protein
MARALVPPAPETPLGLSFQPTTRKMLLAMRSKNLRWLVHQNERGAPTRVLSIRKRLGK